MTLATDHRVSDGTLPGVHVADDPAALFELTRPDCAVAVWSRQIPNRVETWLTALPVDQLPQGRLVLRPNAVAETITHLCDMTQTPKGAERTWFIEDIAALSDGFAQQTAAPYLRVRLQAVTTNACRKFHVDALSSRLVCTYRGTGTQYGAASDGHDPEEIWTVGTGAPIALRGTLWPPTPDHSLKHRSPPIEGTGETRLVLVIDPVHEMDSDIH